MADNMTATEVMMRNAIAQSGRITIDPWPTGRSLVDNWIEASSAISSSSFYITQEGSITLNSNNLLLLLEDV